MNAPLKKLSEPVLSQYGFHLIEVQSRKGDKARARHILVPIEITGVRAGEKMVEDIVAGDEEQLPSGHPAIVVSRPPVPDRAAVHRALTELEYLSPEGLSSELARRMVDLATGSLQPAPAVARDSAVI